MRCHALNTVGHCLNPNGKTVLIPPKKRNKTVYDAPNTNVIYSVYIIPVDKSQIPCVKLYPKLYPKDFTMFYNFNVLMIIPTLAWVGLS